MLLPLLFLFLLFVGVAVDVVLLLVVVMVTNIHRDTRLQTPVESGNVEELDKAEGIGGMLLAAVDSCGRFRATAMPMGTELSEKIQQKRNSVDLDFEFILVLGEGAYYVQQHLTRWSIKQTKLSEKELREIFFSNTSLSELALSELTLSGGALNKAALIGVALSEVELSELVFK
uniref:Uncharacterized protein n=1 Tax=Glossina pallidipes TaxID=7398 RepID=A0A1A9ZHM8_GLOPL